MRRIVSHRPSPAMVVASIALLVAIGGVAGASISGHGGVIKGCYSKSTGLLRVIDSQKSCSKKRERTLSWNQQGVQGLQGIQGLRGLQGVQGEAGTNGSPGVSGLEVISQSSGAQNSNSGKSATATCPAGKRVIGASGEIQGGVDGDDPNQQEHVVIDEVVPTPENVVPGSVSVQAYEAAPGTALNWAVQAWAICANAS